MEGCRELKMAEEAEITKTIINQNPKCQDTDKGIAQPKSGNKNMKNMTKKRQTVKQNKVNDKTERSLKYNMLVASVSVQQQMDYRICEHLSCFNILGCFLKNLCVLLELQKYKIFGNHLLKYVFENLSFLFNSCHDNNNRLLISSENTV